MSYLHKDMLSIKTNKLIVKLITQLSNLMPIIEFYRQQLALLPQFNCLNLFRFLDRGQKGYLTINDFKYVSGKTYNKLIAYAFSYFDGLKLGEISRLEFITFLLPKQNSCLRETIMARIQNPQSLQSENENYSQNIMSQIGLFQGLIMQLIRGQMKLIAIRKNIIKNPDYSINAVLKSIDINSHDYITKQDLYKYTTNYTINIKWKNIQQLFSCFDNQLKGKLVILQIQWIIQAFEGKQSPYYKRIRNACKKSTQNSYRKIYNKKQKHIKGNSKENNKPSNNKQIIKKHQIINSFKQSQSTIMNTNSWSHSKPIHSNSISNRQLNKLQALLFNFRNLIQEQEYVDENLKKYQKEIQIMLDEKMEQKINFLKAQWGNNPHSKPNKQTASIDRAQIGQKNINETVRVTDIRKGIAVSTPNDILITKTKDTGRPASYQKKTYDDYNFYNELSKIEERSYQQAFIDPQRVGWQLSRINKLESVENQLAKQRQIKDNLFNRQEEKRIRQEEERQGELMHSYSFSRWNKPSFEPQQRISNAAFERHIEQCSKNLRRSKMFRLEIEMEREQMRRSPEFSKREMSSKRRERQYRYNRQSPQMNRNRLAYTYS